MAVSALTRRERLRAATIAEIKAIALRHVTDNGVASVSLRAIAREMGMTAGAIYSYFDTRDALVGALIADVYNSVADRLEVALAVAPADPAERIIAYGRAYRRWAVDNPEEFRLVYDAPVSGYESSGGTDAAEAEHRACSLLTGIVALAWPTASKLHPEGGHEWSDYNPAFRAIIRAAFPELPPVAVSVALRAWGRMHGLVSLEVNGHLGPQIADPGNLYEAELRDLARFLGFEATTDLARRALPIASECRTRPARARSGRWRGTSRRSGRRRRVS